MSHIYTLAALAEAVDGQLMGNSALTVSRLVHPTEAHTATDLALATDKKLLPLLDPARLTAAVISADAVFDDRQLQAVIRVKRPRLALAKLTELFQPDYRLPPGVHPTAIVEFGASIAATAAIGAYAYIGANAVIDAEVTIHPQAYVGPYAIVGAGSLIHSGVRIGARVKIGRHAIIHFNAAIGADGFSFVTPEMGSVESARATGAVTASNTALRRIASLGSVTIGDDVEIGANTAIDRGTIVDTRIGNGTKIDNQVQIGHNVQIGENCMICGNVGIAGSAKIGNRVVLGGATGVADHVEIGDDSIAMGMSGIAGNLPPRSLVAGTPALPRQRAMENHMNIGRIKGLTEKIAALMARVEALEAKQ
jgi:UDP-3-O-[3-hydroxymyristoyl] glucosamine N-acyltransferase